jgi:catechol 2,3-dioxygenase-like lactoylglutathione lyase family enzyme
VRAKQFDQLPRMAAIDRRRHGQYLARQGPSGRHPAAGWGPLTHDDDLEGAHPMTIVLNHTIVPAKDKHASARFFADMFGLSYDPADDHAHFAPVRVNDTLTLLFDNADVVKSQHYAFHVSDAEFDAIFAHVKRAGLVYGSAPWSIADGKLNNWGGGRGIYSKDPDGHILELMTVPQ